MIRLTSNQWSRLSEIIGNMSIVFFSSTVIPFILNFNKIATPNLMAGVMMTIGCIIISVGLEKKDPKK